MIARVRAVFRVETLLLALAIGVLVTVGVFERNAKDVPPSVDSYSSYDAASGGYRAAYELLEREGVRVERFGRRPAFLDGEIATLVYVEPILGDPRAQTPAKGDISALEAWVRGGGRLLYIGDDEAAARAGILHLPHLARSNERARPLVAPELRALGVVRIAPIETRRFVSLRERRLASLERRPAAPSSLGKRTLVSDQHGALAVAYAFGRGEVVATIDRALFSNARIAAGDRARLFVALARSSHRRGVVAFDEAVHGYATPERWWSIVPRPFAIALAIAAVALLIALTGAALRLGPPLVPAPRDDRGSADFVDALAALYARNGEIRATLADAAASTSRTIARANGLDVAASKDAIAACIERPDLRASFVTLHDIVTNGYADDATLVRGVALAQHLRKEFVHGRSRN